MVDRMEKEPFVGSVRFFKILILSTVALLILIPTVLSIVFGVKAFQLSVSNQELEKKILILGEQLDEMSLKIEKLEQPEEVPETPKEMFPEAEEWEILLVNDSHPLQRNFEVELEAVGSQCVDVRIREPLEKMMSDMRLEGMRPLVCSGYRTLERQTELFREYVEQKLKEGMGYDDAFYRAKNRIAVPGTSEHQTGLAVDIVGISHQCLDDEQADTEEAVWLEKHCAEYGFILRYPKGKQDITGIEYESWHFRYVGIPAAVYIMEHQMTLEEYLEKIHSLE
ncbi:MAG: M15 family metallopeptidase [Lachnospiraceae bacterium]|nr:M15 family metallopeptidase [Lachnospiraceae bacterium]